MKRLGSLAVVFLVMLASSRVCAQTYHVLHEFNYSDGQYTYCTPILSGSTLYGTAFQGGANSNGSIFKIDTDGSDFTLLHSFSRPSSYDGNQPRCGLALSGSTLYGTTWHGGLNTTGTVYKINTDGSGYSILHSFGGNDGQNPYATVIIDGSTLYGTTGGGTPDYTSGTIYTMNTDGTGFRVLHSFNGGNADGRFCQSRLTLVGSTLYGTTTFGGTNDLGTIFKIATDGSGFTILHSFSGGDGDGLDPQCGLTLGDSALYGMTWGGGSSDLGTVFKIGLDGADFAVLHHFTGQNGDGASPYCGDLALCGSTLYGTTWGGGGGMGTVFSLGTRGDDFEILHSFVTSSEGSNPAGGLVVDGSTLYGTTYKGGRLRGTVFSLVVPEPSSIVLLTIAVISLLACRGWQRMPRK
jgi:uncharacterized repeat protein (TIGR03803 family)